MDSLPRLRHVVVVSCLVAVWLLAGTPAAMAHHLYTPHAGWAKARNGRESITVFMPTAWNLRLSQAVAGWNSLAGWELFQIVRDRKRADVVLKGAASGMEADCRTTDGQIGLQGPNAHCWISLATHTHALGTMYVLEHELGHVLGFAHHVPASMYAAEVASGDHPMVCDDSGHVDYSTYQGVMSYCGPGRLTQGDRIGLLEAGYAGTPLSMRTRARDVPAG